LASISVIFYEDYLSCRQVFWKEGDEKPSEKYYSPEPEQIVGDYCKKITFPEPERITCQR